LLEGRRTLYDPPDSKLSTHIGVGREITNLVQINQPSLKRRKKTWRKHYT